MFDVAIVGCGPVGALAANLMGQAGLRTLVIERELEPHPLPRAVHLDHEMMRLFQAAGVIDRVAPLMRDTDGHLHIGADRGVIRYMGTGGQPRPFGWSNDYFFYQPELEQALRDSLLSLDTVELRTGVALEGLEQDSSGVTLTLRSQSATEVAQAGWVIGCDGARSAVRKLLDVPLDDLDFDEPWLVVDAEVDGPVKFPPLSGVPPTADLQRLSVMMCTPSRPTTVVPGRGNHRRWEFMLLPGESDEEMMSEAVVAKLVGPWLDGVPHQIVRAATYRFHGLIAERWQVGRVCLAGDAAHQTPPFFGQGMCHGLRDIANLAWKLELIVKGLAPPSLLNTYQPERDPHVRAVISAAVAAGRYICMLDPTDAAERDRTMRESTKNDVPATAADLIPAIESGIIAAGSPGAGERFIQPRVAGELLDAVTGSGWRLFVNGSKTTGVRIPGLSVSCFEISQLEDGGSLLNWLDTRGVRAVLVRPDSYVFGTANEPEELIETLAQKLAGDRGDGRERAA